jgi:signal transduction histidine kinase
MDIQREDVISVLITLFLLAVWYVTLTMFDRPLLSVLILWAGMILLSLVYYVVYRKRQRDMRIFKIRFLVSAVPIYPALAFYVYTLLTGTVVTGIFRLLPIGIIGVMLLLNALVVYWYTRRR